MQAPIFAIDPQELVVVEKQIHIAGLGQGMAALRRNKLCVAEIISWRSVNNREVAVGGGVNTGQAPDGNAERVSSGAEGPA